MIDGKIFLMRLLTTSILLALHAAASFLGHAGLHSLEGTGGCHHASHAAKSDHGCCHHHCGSDHGHASDQGGSTGGSEEQPSQESPAEHDHENCVICHWHVQAKVSVAAPVLVVIDSPNLDSTDVEEALGSGLTAYAVRSRGPPLCG